MKKILRVKLTFLFLLSLICLVENVNAQTEEPILKIHYLGHSSFVLQFDNGVSVVTDFGNYNAWGMGSYIHDFGGLVPTVMTYSHTHHADHYDSERIPLGVQHILSEYDSLEIDGLKITPIRVCENDLTNEDNSAYLFNYKGFKFLHLGDAQVQIMNIEDSTVNAHIKNIIPDSLDLLFMTIEGQNQFIPQAEIFVNLVKPKAIIPMHHWSETYLSNFLSYLETQNGSSKNYDIVDSSNSQYNIFENDSYEPVRAIGLKRSPFEFSIKDFDENIYETIKIGSQVWLKENLNSLHYSDGNDIPGVVAYDNNEQNAEIYGRLYTWDAAMKNSTVEGVQGVCPCGWHLPTDNEWTELEEYLGGADIAGGKMKSDGTDFWNTPNTNADNSSGFSVLPGGEYDSHDAPNQFRLINEYAVYWTSTEISTDKARERFLAYNSAASSIYDWYKIMKYSIRCIKNISFYGFTFDLQKGHAPLIVQFNDASDPSLLINSWEWDFNSDGIIDSYTQNPQWTYTESGIYKITTQFSSNSISKTITHEDSIIVFDGESSLNFSELKAVVKVLPKEGLDLNESWTIESWIYPKNLFGKYIFDKASLSFYTNKQSPGASKNSLVVKLTQEDGSIIRISSEDSSLTLDKWQHIAIAYDFSNKILDAYINGVRQELDIDYDLVFDSPIKSNIEDTLLIGNSSTGLRTFGGNIDEVRIWNSALSKEQLDENRYIYLTGTENNLSAYWKMNEGNGKTIFDISENLNDGEIIGAQYDWGIDYQTLVGVKNKSSNASLPNRFSLKQNYPNPFNPSTTIKYSIPRWGGLNTTTNVSLKIYNTLGQEIATLVNKQQTSGNYEVSFDASNLTSGIYFYKLSANGFSISKKMVLVR